MNSNNPKFNLGRIKVSLFAKLALQRSGQNIKEFLNRHNKNCNYGEITTEEKQLNDEIIKSKNRTNKQILSAYITEMHETIWIITRFEKNNKNSTTVLLPEEYDLLFK